MAEMPITMLIPSIVAENRRQHHHQDQRRNRKMRVGQAHEETAQKPSGITGSKPQGGTDHGSPKA